MPGRMTRSAPQSPFELPEVRAVVRATRLSCQNAGKAQKFTPVRGSSGESRTGDAIRAHAGRSDAAAPGRRVLKIFVSRVTDIPAQETSFISWNMSEERHEHNFPFVSRASLEWIEALFYRMAKTRSYPS